MATMMNAAAVKDVIREHAGPVLEGLEANAREARRVIAAGRRAVEEGAVETASQVREHPFAAVAMAAGVGAFLGCCVGFFVGRRAFGCTSG